MNETLTVALIGFLGVMAGGAVQLYGQARTQRNQRADTIRQDVSSLLKATNSYVTTLVQSATELHSLGRAGMGLERARELTRVLTTEFRIANECAIKLMVCADVRVSDQAGALQNMLADAAIRFSEIHPETRWSVEEVKHTRWRFAVAGNILLNTVVPRNYEGFSRFRGLRAATRKSAGDDPSPKKAEHE